MKIEFDLNITVQHSTGEIVSAYVQIRRGKVKQTIEFADGAALADYDKNGYLLGIELLAPCNVAIVDRLAANETEEVRRRTKDFMKRAAPPAMIVAA